MSKIEVLRVPDERLKPKPEYDLTDPPGYTLNAMGDDHRIPVAWKGDLVLVYDGDIDGGVLISALAKPALLAALLEDAGAVRLDFDKGAIVHTGKMGGRSVVKPGRYWLLPIPEDTP